MARGADNERRLLRVLAEWRARRWARADRSLAEIGERAILDRLAALARERAA